MGGRGSGSRMSNSSRGSLFTAPSKGYFTRREYDRESSRLANLLSQATSAKERGKVYDALDKLEKVRVVN